MRADIYDKTSEKNDIGRSCNMFLFWKIGIQICDQQQTPYIGEIFSGEHVAIGVLSAV